MLNFFKRLLLSFFSFVFLFVLAIVLLQDIIIFPATLSSLLGNKSFLKDMPDEDIQADYFLTTDQKKLHYWYLPVKNSKKLAIIFHGNGADLSGFYGYQQYFQNLGISSFSFDYRGFGKSSGWPSEKGLYLDAEAAYQTAKDLSGISAKDILIVGISIGTGPASYLAAKTNPESLILFSPYTAIADIVKSYRPGLMGYLSPFLFYDFPVRTYVSKLSSSNLIVIHGKQDQIIADKFGKKVFEAYQGSGNQKLINPDSAGHNDILDKSRKELVKALEDTGF